MSYEFIKDTPLEEPFLRAQELKILLEDDVPAGTEFEISLPPGKLNFNKAKEEAKQTLKDILLYDQLIREAEESGKVFSYNDIARKCGFLKVEVF